MITKILTNEKIVGVDEFDNSEKETLTTLLQAEFGTSVGVEFRGNYELRVEVDDIAANNVTVNGIIDIWSEG